MWERWIVYLPAAGPGVDQDLFDVVEMVRPVAAGRVGRIAHISGIQ